MVKKVFVIHAKNTFNGVSFSQDIPAENEEQAREEFKRRKDQHNFPWEIISIELTKEVFHTPSQETSSQTTSEPQTPSSQTTFVQQTSQPNIVENNRTLDVPYEMDIGGLLVLPAIGLVLQFFASIIILVMSIKAHFWHFFSLYIAFFLCAFFLTDRVFFHIYLLFI